MQSGEGRILGFLHLVSEDCEIMRMISSDQLSRMLDGGPLRMVVAGLSSGTEDREAMRMT